MSFLTNLFHYKKNTDLKPFVLMYHRILQDPFSEPFPIQPGMYVSNEIFKENIHYLKNNFNVIHLDELLEQIFQGNSKSNHCAVTFDDGWEDNYKNAFPILQEYCVPASFFLTTSFIGTNRWFWFDEVAFFFKYYDMHKQLEVFTKDYIPKKILKIIIKDRSSLGDKISKIVFELKTNISQDNRKHLMSDICTLNRKYGDSKKIMLDWDQVKQMESSGLANFYSHSHTHENLNQCNKDFVMEDISDSLVQIIKHTQSKRAQIFCYPSGKHNATTISVLKNLCFDYAITTERGFVDSMNCYEIKRFGVHNDIAHNLINILR